MKPVLKNTIHGLVRGMAYWLAYISEVSKIKFTEAESIGEIIRILQVKIPNAKIDREVNYKDVCPSIKGNQRADLGIFIDDKCQCLIEVKLNDNTNGGFKKDIKKLTQIKQADSEIDCYVILLYRNSCQINQPEEFVAPDGKALKRTLTINFGKVSCKVRVRRVSNALCSTRANRMKRVVCFEVL